MRSDSIAIGSTTLHADIDTWTKHERERYEVRLLCDDNPFSDYDGIRDFKPSVEEVKEAIDWIIENEDQPNLKGYNMSQIQNLTNEIHKLIDNKPKYEVF